MESLIFYTIKVLGLAILSCVVAVLWTPLLTNFLYKHQLWKKQVRTKTITGEEAIVFSSLHKERETKVPRMGGLLIWVTTTGIIFLFYFLSLLFPSHWIAKFNFLSRDQTWLPLFVLVASSMVGLLDDLLVVRGRGKYIGGGLSFKIRVLIVIILGLMASFWFYQRLGWDVIYIPFLGDVSIGVLYIPLFILVTLACWAGGIVDGLDGLAGGTFASIFGAFALISFFLGRINLASFCAVILGALLAFLWFNIPPARFYLGETGVLGLTMVLAVISFLTNSVYVLPVIGGVLVIEVGSVIIQLIYKKIFKKKLFFSTPIHHHLEAIGWPSYKITMRFWIIGVACAFLGVVIRLLK